MGVSPLSTYIMVMLKVAQFSCFLAMQRMGKKNGASFNWQLISKREHRKGQENVSKAGSKVCVMFCLHYTAGGLYFYQNQAGIY